MSSPSTPTKHIPGAWPERIRQTISSSSSSSGQTVVRQENTASPGQNTPEMPTASTAGDRPLSIVVPSSAYCPFFTDFSLPITSLTLPASYIGKKIMPDFSHEHASSSVPSTPGLDATPSSSQFSSDPNTIASPTPSHFATMPVTPEAQDNHDIATIHTSPSKISPLVKPKASMTLMLDPPKLPDTNLWVSAGSNWLTDLGGNTETDRVFRNTLFGPIPPLSSPIASSIASPASSFPAALLSSMSTSLNSTPISSPSAPSSLNCITSVHSPTTARLALSPTATAAFPSSIDSFERWREDVTVQTNRREIMPETPSVYDDTESSAEHTERTSQPPPGLNQRTVIPHAMQSQTFLQKAKKIGGRVRRFVTRSKRSKWHTAIEAGASDITTHTGSDDGSIVVISARPPPYDTRPSLPIPLQSPEQRRRSMPMLSPHYVLVRERASASAEGSVEVPRTAPPADARGLTVSRVPTRRFSLAAFSSLAPLKRP
ncbi:hypothetical protein DEU56DRAFT_976613 [Suillus clintonianus]|uniref:uncharacterized protein n=1 Tax=Suillus clintonianus TaxID=1904413 RepID=UPI001B862863|nr:uncharacterized protein DEU56DRAFT_976613 [Suillus clintonianus]KAG2154902.1 hypothetical protein DEU56DRAFT_976613 [Suillus clintonianus]